MKCEVFFMLGFMWSNKNYVEKNFGKNPIDSWYYDASDRMEEVARFHNELKDEEELREVVDEITWNDLEMDKVFLRINHTNSFIGEQFLYHRLHKVKSNSSYDEKQNLQMERKLKYLKEHKKERLETELRLQKIGKNIRGYSLTDFIDNVENLPVGATVLYRCLQLLLAIFGIASIFLRASWCVALFIMIFVFNLLVYQCVKARYEGYTDSFMCIKDIYDFAKWMVKTDKAGNICDAKEMKKVLQRLKKLSSFVGGMNSRRQGSLTGDMMVILNDYLWGATLFDIANFGFMMKLVMKNREDIYRLLYFAGVIDSNIAIVSYRESVDKWCIPVFEEDKELCLKFIGMVHPLLEEPVANDFSLEGKAIITGVNASGKSTFMKCFAINLILGESINTCLADEAYIKHLKVMSCMALRDDVMSGESYYFREAKYIKRMLDELNHREDVLIVIDEILKGTNTKERIAASRAILEYVESKKCYLLVATHDIELAIDSMFDKYCFDTNIIEDKMFDYKIKGGVNTRGNAIELLEYLGYYSDIVIRAKKEIEGSL